MRNSWDDTMSQQPRIAILLATYNGATFLSAQLDSLLAQTYTHFIIVARDDGSTDDTPQILARYRSDYPDKFHLVGDGADNKGASASFSCLMEYALEHKEALDLPAAYLMFCDQDDIWYPDKIERQMQAMLALEADGASVPVLVHSDLRVVAADGQMLAPSFVRYQGLELSRNSFEGLVFSNLVTGCSALCNEALALQATPVAKHAIMHDWWLALVAAAFGKLVFLDMPLVDYRQHGANTIGAKQHVPLARRNMNILQKMAQIKPNALLYLVAGQAEDFYARFGKQLGRRQRIALRIAIAMSIKSGLCQRSLRYLASKL